MFTPWNSFSACLLARSDRIGGDRLDLLNQSHVNPLGLSSEFRIPSSEFGNAPYALRHAPCLLLHWVSATSKKVFLKAPPTQY